MASPQGMVLLLAALISTTNAGEFLGAKRKVNSMSVKVELNGVLGEVLGHGHGVNEARLTKIRKLLDPLFKSLPKNNQGHISSSVMRYAVRRYFSQNHGWMVKGFNAYEEFMNTSNAVDTDILQSKLPDFIRSLLEEQFAHNGFSLDAVVAMVASLERLVFDEVVRGVELAFYVNDYERAQELSNAELKDVLQSYLIIEMLQGSEDKTTHAKHKKHIRRRYPHWDTTVLFLEDLVGSDVFQRQTSSNPFGRRAFFSFEDVVRMAERISEEFGSWSNHECHDMKDMLTEMDVHGTGRVKLSDFYRYTKDGAWQFLEPAEQLRQAGSLDETSTWEGPQVMIPNYINSMSNCITSSPYYSICCLNECDQVFLQLETRIGAPSATASDIIQALESSTYAPNLYIQHVKKLQEIAQVTNDQIPLHGRLFARWLHFVYPHECPYPHAAGTVTLMTQKQWKELVGAKYESATKDEIAQHVESDVARRAPSPDAGASMWNLDEEILEFSTPSDLVASPMWRLLRIFAQIGMVGGFLSMLAPLWQMMHSNAKSKPVEYDV